MDILMHVRLRKSLATVAKLLSGCETRPDAIAFLQSLQDELLAIESGRIESPVYQQAASALDGPSAYGLERIGLWPGS